MLGTLSNFYCLNADSRIKFIEGMRAVAVIMVFNTHCLAAFAEKNYFLETGSLAHSLLAFLQAGPTGVDLFFVLSGYLISKTIHRQKPTAINFFSNRVLRLIPVNTFVLIFLALPIIDWPKLIQNIFLLPSFFPKIPYLNFVTWSLGWEWLFYITIYATFKIFKNLSEIYLLCVYTLTMSVILLAFHLINQNYFLANNAPIVFPEPGRFAGFYVGILVAIFEKKPLLHQCWKGAYTYIALLALLSLILLFSIAWNSVISQSYILSNVFFIAISFSYGAILLAFLIKAPPKSLIREALQSIPLRIIGQVSYSFYLIHVCTGLHFTNKIFGAAINNIFGIFLYYLTAFLISFLVASLLFFIFERPYMIQKNRV